MSSGGKGEMKGDAEADRKLLLGVLKVHDFKINYQALTQFMTTDNAKPTALGIQNRTSKLKSMVKSSSPSADSMSSVKPNSRKRGNSVDDGDASGTKAKVPKIGNPTKRIAANKGDGEQMKAQGTQADFDSSSESWLTAHMDLEHTGGMPKSQSFTHFYIDSTLYNEEHIPVVGMSSSTQDSEYNHHEKAKRKSAAGRKLVRWDPGLDQLVLLCVDHVCTKNAIAIPWDDVAELVEPYLTGEAIKQHLVKIYKYRETDGQKVPPKLGANQRRKPFGIPGNNDDPAPVAAKKNKKGSSGDTNKDKAPVEPAKPGGSLLFNKGGSKGKKSSKSQGATATTPAASRGRKQFPAPLKTTPIARGAEANANDDGFAAPKPKSKTAGRGTKRGSRNAGSIDDDDESYLSTPTKQQKTAGGRSFRTRPNVDYSKQLAQADDDGDDTYEDDEAAKNNGLAQQHESPASNNSFHEERNQGFNPYGMVDAPTPAQSNHEFGRPTRFDGQPVNGSGGVAGFRSYDGYTDAPFAPFPTGHDFPHADEMPPFAFNNSNNNNDNPLMSGVQNSNRFTGVNHYNISGTMGAGGNRAINNEMANNYTDTYDMGGTNNGNIVNGVPRVFTQQSQGGFNANAVMKTDSDTYFTSSPTDMTDSNPSIIPATTQDSFTPMPAQQFVDPSKTNRLHNSYDSGYYDSQMGSNDFYDHDTHFDAFPHDPAFDADRMFDGFAPGDEHSMFHPMDGGY
ncbi:hypothetical protein KC351_g9817 [Hortaea werneckii]|nr:hypothetical protein KC351_g9817 [Hortaea werneckii]